MIQVVSRIALSTIVVLMSLQSIACAATFAGIDDGTRKRFLDGAAPVLDSFIAVNPNFPISESSISGIAIDSGSAFNQGAVLITPRHYVAANHNLTNAPWFRGSDGIIRQYQTVATTLLTTDYEMDGMMLTGDSDIRIWTLDDTVPLPGSHGVVPMPILVGPASGFLGREIYASDQFNEFGRNVIDDLVVSAFENPDGTLRAHTNSIVYDFDSLASGDGVGADEIFLRSGDSGNAAIAIVNGTPALIGNHFGIDTTVNPRLSFSTWLSPYVDGINAYTQTQGGYTVSTIVVPEPSTGTALLIAVATYHCRRRRRSQCL